MERKVIEFSVDSCSSVALESLKRARKKAGIRDADIKPATKRTAKQTTPAAGKRVDGKKSHV